MKRHFVIIALCSIVLSLTSCIKPANESFVGTYKGTLITTYTINVQGNYETNVEDTDFTIAIAQGDKRDEVIATCSAYGQNFTLNGTVDDDQDRKSTRLNSSHQIISYAVFCLKKKK